MRSPLEIIDDLLGEHGTDVEAEDIVAALEAEGWALVLDRDAIANEE
jgi:hypothetical protein